MNDYIVERSVDTGDIVGEGLPVDETRRRIRDECIAGTIFTVVLNGRRTHQYFLLPGYPTQRGVTSMPVMGGGHPGPDIQRLHTGEGHVGGAVVAGDDASSQ